VPHVRTIEVLARQLIFPQPARGLMVEVRVTPGRMTPFREVGAARGRVIGRFVCSPSFPAD
jgi:hypothetical protein